VKDAAVETFNNILVFDTETYTDTKQELRVGYFEEYTGGSCTSASFFGPENARGNVLRAYESASFLSTDEFRRKLSKFAYSSNSLVVGFNLPFDISRIASEWSPARGNYEGGFSFALTNGTSIRVKHLAKHKALLGFSGKGVKGKFCDVSTIAKALYSRGFSLSTLADYLSVQHPKTTTDYNGPMDRPYLDYLQNDVRCTYECFISLREKWASYGLSKTGINNVISEASIGKAFLKEMGVQPFMKQNDWEPELMGSVLGTYYGGRSEVHLRKTMADVVCLDFLSMYPTVCSLMNLWQFVIADKIVHRDCTVGARKLVDDFNLNNLQDESLWNSLHIICQVDPDDDIFPVRAKYNGVSKTVGVNYVSSSTPIWYTLADCYASKLLTGETPKILKAIRFYPSGQQKKLKTLHVLGNEQYPVDPYNSDFYRRLIELRTTTDGDERLAIKLIANSTCYGIFIEVITKSIEERSIEFYSDEKHRVAISKEEKAGTYFNPLLATLITSAARLLIAGCETLSARVGLDWVLCDTDSMFLTGHNVMENVNFVTDFFQKLNPYAVDANVLKNENPKDEPLECYAISAKRYVLFNKDGTIFKASSHGLGHLSAPYGARFTKTRAAEWINDMWVDLLHPENTKSVHMLRKPAMAQFTASTPRLARKIPPFSFVSVFQMASDYPGLKTTPIAPFGIDPVETSLRAFDTDTLQPIPACYLKTYAEVLLDYPDHHESKFNGGDDVGWTSRRRVYVSGIGYIGKEGNKLEEQEVGLANADILEYGNDTRHAVTLLQELACVYTYTELSRWLDISRSEVSRIVHGTRRPSRRLLVRINELSMREIPPRRVSCLIHGGGGKPKFEVREYIK
jgi:hypothetical protein